jgi:cytochrome c-type biogenesis protein
LNLSSVLFTFLEGILAFISPCILPMLPVYIMYLTGNSKEVHKKRLIINTLGFITGFTIVFVLLGATATSLGKLVSDNRLILQRVGGAIIILFGLNLMDIIKPAFLNREIRFKLQGKTSNFSSSILFGIVFSFGWTPCLGTFLGSALLMASNMNTVISGILLLIVFSLGLGIPFLITAVIFDKLTNVFTWIKKNYRTINFVSGIVLITVGFLMLTDIFGYYARLFYF